MNFFELLEDGKNRCIHNSPPACSHGCPLGIDIREFIKQIRSGLIVSAYKIFQTNAVMPGIVCHLCTEPCKDACVRKDIDSSVSLKELERFCWQEMHEQKKKSYFMREKNEHVLICGGDVGQLTVALKLARRGYPVELAVKGERLGGSLWDIDENILPRQVLEEDLNEILSEKFITVLWNTEKIEPDKISDCDAVLLSRDYKLSDDELFGNDFVFIWDGAGSPMENIHKGSLLSYQIEEYVKIHRVFKTKELEVKEKPYVPEPTGIDKKEKIKPLNEKRWTKEEAINEAERCLMCQCTLCSDACPMMQHYNQGYRKLAVAINDTVEAQEIDRKRGLYPLMSCMQCGACVEACPVDIDTKALCLQSRRLIHKKKTLPEAHYNFWLNDMNHADKEAEFMVKPEVNSEYLYFPGCQMGASYPEYVDSSYAWLRRLFDNKVSLWNRCCCAPAYWSGNEELYANEAEKIRIKWKELGKPIFILSCPTCMEQFRDNFHEIEIVSLWSLLAENLEVKEGKSNGEIAVFDSCAARNDVKLQADIRTIVSAAGYDVIELDKNKESAQCCGYGGLVYSTNPEFIGNVIEQNSIQDDHEFVTYCTNCMDSFRMNNKKAHFIFDLVFEMQPQQEVPDLTSRRVNRMKLKDDMLKKYMNIESEDKKMPYENVYIDINEEIRQKINKQLILEDDIRNVIGHAEESELYLYEEDTDERVAHRQSGYITVWVRYRETGANRYEVCNVYFHRAMLKGEQGDGK